MPTLNGLNGVNGTNGPSGTPASGGGGDGANGGGGGDVYFYLSTPTDAAIYVRGGSGGTGGHGGNGVAFHETPFLTAYAGARGGSGANGGDAGAEVRNLTVDGIIVGVQGGHGGYGGGGGVGSSHPFLNSFVTAGGHGGDDGDGGHGGNAVAFVTGNTTTGFLHAASAGGNGGHAGYGFGYTSGDGGNGRIPGAPGETGNAGYAGSAHTEVSGNTVRVSGSGGIVGNAVAYAGGAGGLGNSSGSSPTGSPAVTYSAGTSGGRGGDATVLVSGNMIIGAAGGDNVHLNVTALPGDGGPSPQGIAPGVAGLGSLTVLANTVDLGSGDDTLTVQLLAYQGAAVSFSGNTLMGGSGTDTLVLQGSYLTREGGVAAPIVFDLSENTISGFEVIRGSSSHETILGTAQADNIDGDQGNDALLGKGGADTLSGGSGEDTMTGGMGNDSLDGGNGNDVAVFSGARADYSATVVAGRPVVVSQVRGAQIDGIDTISNVEIFRFTDGDFTLAGLAVDPNLAPTAIGDTATVAEKATVVIDVLANDTDPNAGDMLSLVSVSTTLKGATVSMVDGKIVYAADAQSLDLLALGQSTKDSFSYVMRDAVGITSSANVQVTVTGVANGATKIGGAGADTLSGTGLDEKLDGGAGNDSLSAGGGTDTVLGGAGADTIDGGAGIDSISAGDGNDSIVGGGGDDVLAGGRGNDVFEFRAGFGNDTIIDFRPIDDDIRFVNVGFESFSDVLAHAMQSGANLVITTAAGDRLQLNNTQLSSLKASDFVFVNNTGNDTINGSPLANDTLLGGAGNDLIGATSFMFRSVDGGNDIMEVTGASGGGADLLNGNSGNDTIIGGPGDNTIFGEDGDDFIVDGGGVEFPGVIGGGHDTIDAGAGNDTVIASGGSDVILFGDGDDVGGILGSGSATDSAILDGGAGDDEINGGAGRDQLFGGSGNDTLDGWGGADTESGGGGADVFQFYLGEAGTVQAQLDRIIDWNGAEDGFDFEDGIAGIAIGVGTVSNYFETTAADYSSALTLANSRVAGGIINYVAVQIAGDVYVFADTGHDNGVADSTVMLVGRSLNDIAFSNFLHP